MACPVIWTSKLQPSIACSTMEAEYTALSMGLRATIPLLATARAAIAGLRQSPDRQVAYFRATVHEDNQPALTLAKLEPGRDTPRSKFYAVKLHWFRSWLKPNKIELKFCPSDLQKADFLTKHLPHKKFAEHRKMVMGW